MKSILFLILATISFFNFSEDCNFKIPATKAEKNEVLKSLTPYSLPKAFQLDNALYSMYKKNGGKAFITNMRNIAKKKPFEYFKEYFYQQLTEHGLSIEKLTETKKHLNTFLFEFYTATRKSGRQEYAKTLFLSSVLYIIGYQGGINFSDLFHIFTFFGTAYPAVTLLRYLYNETGISGLANLSCSHRKVIKHMLIDPESKFNNHMVESTNGLEELKYKQLKNKSMPWRSLIEEIKKDLHIATTTEALYFLCSYPINKQIPGKSKSNHEKTIHNEPQRH